MKIANRKHKEEYNDSKILREVTLFLLLLYGKRPYISVERFQSFFGYISMRTSQRYIQDLLDCGAVSDITLGWHHEAQGRDAIMGKVHTGEAQCSPSDFNDSHLVRLARLCTIAKTIPDINLRLGMALESNDFDDIFSDINPFSSVSKLREYCPYDIDNRTYQRDIRLIDGALKKYAEYMSEIISHLGM